MTGGQARSLWSFPGFRRMFAAKAVSAAGSYMQLVAATWYAYQLSGSAASVGVLSALALGPALVGGPLGGALVDRFDLRRLAVVLSLLQAVPAAAMAALDLTGALSLWSFYLLVFVGAIPLSLNQPVITLVLPYTVPMELRPSALALSSMMFNLTRLAGAVAGGITVERLGWGVAFAANAASYLLLAAVLAATPLMSDVSRAARPGRSAGVREGIRDARRTMSESGLRRVIRFTAVGVAVFFTFIAPVEQLMPTVVDERGMTASALGLLIGAIGVGALLANPVIGRANASGVHRRLMEVGLFLAAAGMTGLALAHYGGLPVALTGAGLIGFGWEFVFVGAQSMVAIDVPDAVRGRAMGLFFVLVTATAALGAVAMGEAIDLFGIMATFLGSAAVVVLTGVVLMILDGARAARPPSPGFTAAT